MSGFEVRVLELGAEGYPEALLALSAPPEQLFHIGNESLLARPMAAIVGTRDATPYGVRTARMLGQGLGRAGITVVSGMARGVDEGAHRGALDTPGATVAVLGTGADVPYPVGHRELHRAIAERGLLVSESPPGSRAFKGAFPKRNRIIAALARVTFVVEAGDRSGAAITAGHALELGRVVAAIPGSIESAQSRGTNRLIRDGASVVTDLADALTLMGVESLPQAEPAHLGESDARVWSSLGAGAATLETIAARSGLPARECLASITSLELQGMVESLVTGEVRRR